MWSSSLKPWMMLCAIVAATRLKADGFQRDVTLRVYIFRRDKVLCLQPLRSELQ
jgi:hypothetical protein